MPRLPRLYVPGLPQHVVQRGNDRRPTFVNDADRHFYLATLGFAARRHGVQIHAYVLMTNHVHLLATPSDASGLSKVMQSLGRIYVRYFNRAYARIGTLWESRYRSAVVQTDGYLLACMRYIELNPLRAGLVAAPADWRWSSHAANAQGVADPLVTPHQLYVALASSPAARREAYRALFAEALPTATADAIRDATVYGWALGNEAFHARVSALSRRSRRVRAGRARKPKP